MAGFDQLFLAGHAKPLDLWSDRALQQTRDDITLSLEHERSRGGRLELSQSLETIDRELQRRADGLSPRRIESEREGSPLLGPDDRERDGQARDRQSERGQQRGADRDDDAERGRNDHDRSRDKGLEL